MVHRCVDKIDADFVVNLVIVVKIAPTVSSHYVFILLSCIFSNLLHSVYLYNLISGDLHSDDYKYYTYLISI